MRVLNINGINFKYEKKKIQESFNPFIYCTTVQNLVLFQFDVSSVSQYQNVKIELYFHFQHAEVPVKLRVHLRQTNIY